MIIEKKKKKKKTFTKNSVSRVEDRRNHFRNLDMKGSMFFFFFFFFFILFICKGALESIGGSTICHYFFFSMKTYNVATCTH